MAGKKQEMRDRKSLMDKFEKVAYGLTKKSPEVSKAVTVTKRGGEEVPETAGMLKKKKTKKKEKSLGAKLRLKEKKNK